MSTETPATPADAKPAKKKRTWRRRFILLGIACLLLAVIGRVIITVAFPTVLHRVAGLYDLDASYSRMEFYVLGGDVGLWDLTVKPKGGGDPLMTVEYCRADVSALNLLRGKLVVHRAELDATQLSIVREADGRIPALEKLLAGIARNPPPVALPDPDISLEAPLRVDAVRVGRLRAHWTDRSIAPQVDTDFEMTVRLSDFGSQERPTKLLLEATSPPLLDTLRIEGEGYGKGRRLDVKLDVLVRGIHPKPAAGYLAPLGLRPVGDSITLTCDAIVKVQAAGGEPVSGSTTRPTDIIGNVTLEKIVAMVDGAEAAGVDRVDIDADAINGASVRLGKVNVDGVRANATRTDAGKVRVGGLELMTPTPSTRPAAAPSPQPAPVDVAAATPTTSPAGLPIAFAVRELAVRNVKASFRDAAVTPAGDLAVVVDQLTVKDIDSTRPDAPAQIAGAFAAPGVAKVVRVTATARPFAQTRLLEGKVIAEGVHPNALRGYLDPLGLESTLTDATMTADLRAALAISPLGRIDADARLANIKFTDAGRELLAFDTAHLSGVSLDPKLARLRVEAIDLSGPRIIAHRAADGSVAALGLRTKTPTATPIATLAAAPSTQPAAIATAATKQPAVAPVASQPLPRIELGRLTWKGADVQLTDDAVTPPTKVRINNAGVELSNLLLDLNASAAGKSATTAPTQPGRIRAYVAAAGIAEAFEVTGTLTPGGAGRPFTADLVATGKGLNADLLAPYVKAAGIEPVLKDGSLKLKAKVAIAGKPGAIANASLAVTDFSYADEDRELVGVDALTIDDAAIATTGVTVASITIAKPRARVERNADNSFSAAGIRVNIPSTQPTVEPTPAPAVAAAPMSQPAPATPAAAFVAALGKLRITDSALTWSDKAVSPAVEATARANVDLNNFVFGRDGAPPATLKLAAKIDETLESFTADGTLAASLTAPAVQMSLAGTGIRQGVLASYLPPGTSVALKDGRFRAKLEASAAPHAQGGQSAKLIVSDVDYRDGDAAAPLLALDAARVVVARADVPGKVIAVDEVSLAGFETAASKSADGSLNALGLKLSSPPPTKHPQTPLPVAAPVTAAAPSTQPAAGPGPSANQLIAAGRETLPLVTLDKLDVNLKRVAFADESNADGKPIALADVKLSNKSRIELLGDDPQNRPPVELLLTGTVDPVVGKFDVLTVVAPFASQPSLNVTVAASGINGEGVAQVLPAEVRQQLNPSPMTDGRFAATIEASAKVAKRGPAHLDFSKPMEISAIVRDVAFRGDADGNSPILAGVEEVRADGVRIDPQKGSAIARSVEITKPIARAWRDEGGIHAIGLVLKDPTTKPAAASQPAVEPTPAPAPEAQLASNSNGATTTPPQKPQAELAIEKLTISGVDVNVEDHTCDPHFTLPLNQLGLEARGLSNMVLYEPRPVRFNMTAGAGKVPLDADKPPREVFSEVAASGNLTLYPRPAGWARSTVSGFELLSVRGPAAQQKVEITSGVFDGRVDLRFKDDGAIDTRSRFAFTDLRMTEPKDGPIRRTLQLPGPLDAMIVVLQDASGAITVPLNVSVKEGSVGGGQIAGAAVTALGSILTTAMASAPLKVAGGVTGMVGLGDGGGKKKEKGPQEAGAIDFYAGADESESSVTLNDLIERLRRDRTLEVTLHHELGGGDVSRAAMRANPSSDEAGALAAQLRQHKADLLARRAELAPTARAMVVADSSPNGAATSDAIAQLRDADAQLAATEDALDRVYDLLRPGAERQADRRTRTASLSIAQQRLDAIKQLIVAAGIPDAETRVKVTKPQFTAAAGDAGGRVTMVVTSKKKP